jgi:PAS domain S-box-containing protein
VAEQAGAMALAIVDLANRGSTLKDLAQSLATYLAAALHANAVALYWRHTYERHGEARPLLKMVAMEASGSRDRYAAEERLKLVAYRGLIAGRMVERLEPDQTVNGRAAGRHSLSLPIGEAETGALLAVEWHGAVELGGSRVARVVALCAPTLTLAFRPAQQLEEAHRAEKSAGQRHSVFALTSEAVVTIGEDLSILEINPAFGSVLGWQEGSVLGRGCAEVLRCRDGRNALLCGTALCPVRQALGSTHDIPVTNVSWETSSGQRRDVSASISVHHAPVQSQVVVVARDVTALNTADRMRSNFISMVSHELRTPLNSINGFLEIVAEEQVGPLNERQHEFLSYARQSTQQLTTLVEDILFITKADSGEFKLRWTDVELSQLASQAAKGQAAAAQKAGVRVTVLASRDLPSVHVDELRLQQVLNNLLSNAIKFSPPGSEVRLMVRRDGDTMLFAVQDGGVGVALEDQARIFDRFYQAESTVRARGGGYGLGLAIAKLIVEQHGGVIWVESEPGSGATFCFTVPITRHDMGPRAQG